MINDLGFEKAKRFDPEPHDGEKVKDTVREMLGPDSVKPADDACCSSSGGYGC
jgi:hypothetical protein